MSHHINKTDIDRWFCIETTEDIIHVFGQVNLGNILDTGEHTLITYLTEDAKARVPESANAPMRPCPISDAAVSQ